MGASPFVGGAAGTTPASAPGCALNAPKSKIQHVVSIVFDNTHFMRDRSNVASDLEQMPHLLNFLTDNGTLLTNDHTGLIAHTAGGILSGLTGLYADRQGQTVSNSYLYFTPSGSPTSTSSFKYWTDLVDDSTGTRDPLPNMVTNGQKTTPAPWVPFTRAGCDWGGVSTANAILENTGTGTFGDMTQVFGAGSPEWNEANTSNLAPSGTAARAKALTDFIGIGIHCGQGGGICNQNTTNSKGQTSCPTRFSATPASTACSARSTSTRRSARGASPRVARRSWARRRSTTRAAGRSPTRSGSPASRASTACPPR